MVDLRGLLDPVAGEIVRKAIERREHELFLADCAVAGQDRSGVDLADGSTAAALGRGELPRTPGQRRADALVALAEAAQAVPEGATRPRPLISVVVGYEQLAGPVRETFNRIVLTPGQVARLLITADIERVVYAGPGRIMEIGHHRRFFTGADRRALEVRDRHCQFPGSDVDAEWCDADHIVEHADGGLTTQANGRLLCPRHNHQRPGRRATRPTPTPDDPDPPDGPGP